MRPSRSPRQLVMGGIMVAVLLAVSCTGTETGNPEFSGQVALTADSSEPNCVSFGTGGSVLSVTEAWVNFERVRFVRSSDCDSEEGEIADELENLGPRNLAAGQSVISFAISGGLFCRLRVDIDNAEEPLPVGAPARLNDQTILLSGERADGTPFEILSDVGARAEIRSDEPFEVSEAQRALLLSFDIALWLGDLGIEDLPPGPDGRITIGGSSNRDVLDRFDENVERALGLFRDDDEDGEFDPEDRAALLAIGNP